MYRKLKVCTKISGDIYQKLLEVSIREDSQNNLIIKHFYMSRSRKYRIAFTCPRKAQLKLLKLINDTMMLCQICQNFKWNICICTVNEGFSKLQSHNTSMEERVQRSALNQHNNTRIRIYIINQKIIKLALTTDLQRQGIQDKLNSCV